MQNVQTLREIAAKWSADFLGRLPESPQSPLTLLILDGDNAVSSGNRGDPNGSRTRVSRVRTWYPRPLDDGTVAWGAQSSERAVRCQRIPSQPWAWARVRVRSVGRV